MSKQSEPEVLKVPNQVKLLELLVNRASLTSDQLKSLVIAMDNVDVLAKVFLLEGLPHVFSNSPMKYLIFREQVADRFEIGYQDVCIVGSAKLGFSPTYRKYGASFSETSDVDVVVISQKLFDTGTHCLFEHIATLDPKLEHNNRKAVTVDHSVWKLHKEAVRNFVYNNFNPAHLPYSHPLRDEIFTKISSTSALFLALEPQVFVNKIRCRVFKSWKAAELYYTNTLRQLKIEIGHRGSRQSSHSMIEDVEEDDGPEVSDVGIPSPQ